MQSLTSTSFQLTLAALVLLVVRAVLRRNTSRRPAPPPPGPRRLPIVGNIFDMPTQREWIKFAAWGEKYGDICSVSMLGQQITIINSAQIAMQMLDKKGAIYSDRAPNQMGGELAGWKDMLILTPYGERFRTYRRHAHSVFGSRANMASFEPLEEREVHRMLQRVLKDPEGLNLQQHIRKAVGSIILRISHGYQVKEGDDAYVNLAEMAMSEFSQSFAPGGFLVNFIPALRFVPSWVPGAGFQTTAKQWRKDLYETVEQPFRYVKNQMAAGTAEKSVLAGLMEGKTLTEKEEFEVKWLSASLYTGGADTTVATIHSFFKAMLVHPEIQARAQAELDAVVGPDRLPSFADKEQLPYVSALALEVHRWHVVAPTGVPHRVTQDDVHEGWLIPEGSLVITNIWKMAHDPRTYADPTKFNPERFIAKEGKPAELDPRELAFGFGRRICPGRALADQTLWIAVAMTLSTFNIEKHPDGGEVDMEQAPGLLSHPTPFKCTLKPRSHKAVEVVQEEVRD